jgi:hypothetical protein
MRNRSRPGNAEIASPHLWPESGEMICDPEYAAVQLPRYSISKGDSMDGIWDWLWGNLAWTFLAKTVVLSGIINFLGFILARFSFGWKPTKAQIWTFLLAFPIFVFLLLVAINPATPRPQLALQIDFISWGGSATKLSLSPPSPNGGSQTPNNISEMNPVLVMATVSNIGSGQSAARNWSLSMEIEGRTYIGQASHLPEIVSVSPANRTAITYYGSDALYERSLLPISPGSLTTGLLMFVFPEINPATVNGSLPIFTLSAEDVYGRVYTVKYTSKGQAKGGIYIPGVRQQMTR